MLFEQLEIKEGLVYRSCSLVCPCGGNMERVWKFFLYTYDRDFEKELIWKCYICGIEINLN
jgi:hypothetical protein